MEAIILFKEDTIAIKNPRHMKKVFLLFICQYILKLNQQVTEEQTQNFFHFYLQIQMISLHLDSNGTN